MTPLRVEPFTSDHATAWNAFVRRAKNGHFLFDRGYMDYHADRFHDASLLVACGNEVIALLPANRTGDEIHSHQGLTFGGLVLDEASASTAFALRAFDAILTTLKANGVSKLVYKALPHIYHARPSEEDIYALFRMNARLARVDVTTTIDLMSRGRISPRRLRGVKKSAKAGATVGPSENWAGFWNLLTRRLRERHGISPVHSLTEIQLLASRFPDRIRLLCATIGSEVFAGVVLYSTDRVAHAQYISASDEGLEIGALDGLLEWLIASQTPPVRYFDFGVSTEQLGHVLNEGLIAQKEGFGGSAVVHAVYEVDL